MGWRELGRAPYSLPSRCSGRKYDGYAMGRGLGSGAPAPVFPDETMWDMRIVGVLPYEESQILRQATMLA